VQISDENVHLLRSVMDEVFGSENFVSLIAFTTTSGFPSNTLSRAGDYIIWYSKSIDKIKYRQLFRDKSIGDEGATKYKPANGYSSVPKNIFKDDEYASIDSITSQGETGSEQSFSFKGNIYTPPKGMHWKTTIKGLNNLVLKHRLVLEGNSIRYVRLLSDYPVFPINNLWNDVAGVQNRVDGKIFVVQTAVEVLKRCILMSTDPGDLVLDPTCGSGTTAYVAEQFGRRWITIDTSRIAINIAKQRIMTAVFPYYKLYDETKGDIRQGFIYKTVPHITLKSLANDEPAQEETLYDQPLTDKSVLRVSGPFTVETLQNFEPVSPSELEEETLITEEVGEWEEKIKQHLLSTGIKNGRKDERVDFTRVELLADAWLHAEGFYHTAKGEHKAYFHIGPRFGTVSKEAVNKAIVACRQRGDANWLVILGFSFESDIQGGEQTTSIGSFEVTKAKIHDDLLQEGLKKKPAKSAASFITIGEPDVAVNFEDRKVNKETKKFATVTIEGLDIYDPIRDEVKARNIHEIAYWMLDDDYDGSNFVVKQVFFCGGDKTEFDKWKRGLGDLSESRNRRKKELQDTLKIEIDEDAFDRLYGHTSHTVELKRKGQKMAVRIVSLYGEETTKVILIG
jgi:adenine-specific DNA-methyltransferase